MRAHGMVVKDLSVKKEEGEEKRKEKGGCDLNWALRTSPRVFTTLQVGGGEVPPFPLEPS